MVLKDQRSRLIIAHWLTIGCRTTFRNIYSLQEMAIALQIFAFVRFVGFRASTQPTCDRTTQDRTSSFSQPAIALGKTLLPIQCKFLRIAIAKPHTFSTKVRK
jgi:hypothetical protein